MFKNYLAKMALSVLVGFSSLSFPMAAFTAEESTLPVLNTDTRTVAIFKNGLGFFIREGEVSLKDGWAVTEYVPDAALGSIWIGSLDKGANLEKIIGFKEEVTKEIEAISIEELLKANIGKKAILTFEEQTIEGTIKSVPEDREIEKEDGVGDDYQRIRPPQPKLATIVIIDTKAGEVVLNRNKISKIEFPESCAKEFSVKEKAKRIKFKVATRKEKTRLGLSYLQKGISWVPSYLVDIENPKKARITMKATVINDVEDLRNVDMYFVVGYPNFMYADILSPMALEESLNQFISSLERMDRRPAGRTAIMYQRVASAGLEKKEAALLDYAAIRETPGVAEEDLFLYHKKDINFKKGERADFYIFSDEVNYKHIYQWEIPDALNLDPYARLRREENEKPEIEVWHSIKLSNSTKYPWTTAPALTVRGSKPLAQDIINYTPKGTQVNLKITAATDIKTRSREYEIEREHGVRIGDARYDLVTVRGELYLKNCKSKDIEIEIKKTTTGEVIEAGYEVKVEQIAEGIRGVNPKSLISWEFPLPAGKEKTIYYKYRVYVQ